VANETFHWMMEGVHYKVDFTTFGRLLGFASGDRYADSIQTHPILKPDDIIFAYERSYLANGRIVGLKSFYYAMNNLFRETINPKVGDSTSLRNYAKNLLGWLHVVMLSLSVGSFGLS